MDGEGAHRIQARREAFEPDGVNVLGSERASRDMRDRYVAHLTRLHADECITAEEFAARRDAALSAVTLDELRVLTRDVPGLPAPPPGVDLASRWKQKSFYVPVLIGGVIMLILVAVSPFVLLGLLGLQNDSKLMTPLGVAGILTGIVGVIACAVTLFVKLEDDKD